MLKLGFALKLLIMVAFKFNWHVQELEELHSFTVLVGKVRKFWKRGFLSSWDHLVEIVEDVFQVEVLKIFKLLKPCTELIEVFKVLGKLDKLNI